MIETRYLIYELVRKRNLYPLNCHITAMTARRGTSSAITYVEPCAKGNFDAV